MEKEKKEIKINKKFVFIIVSVVVIIGLLIIVSKKPRLESNFKSLGSDFYTEYYYKTISKSKTEKEVKNFLSDFKEIGIVASLRSIDTYNQKGHEKEIKKLKNAKCDFDKSTVTIYPKKPYGKKDFTVKVKLSCK